MTNRITPRQLSILLILYIFGDFVIFINTPNDPQHGWIAYIISSLGGFLILAVYLWIYKLNDSKPLPLILNNCFGKYVGVFVSLMYVLFFMCNASLVLYNYTAYVNQTSYDYTPKWVMLLFLGIIIIYAMYKGIRAIARSAEIFLSFILIATIFVDILVSGLIKVENIYPIKAANYYLILKDAFYPFSLSFGVCVTFLILFPLAGNVGEIKKPLFKGMGLSSALLIIITLRTILILSGPMINRYVYPIFFSYSINEEIKIGIVPVALTVVGTLIKVLIFLYGSTTSIKSVFNIRKIRPIIIVAVVVTVVSSNFSFNTGIAIHEFFQNIWVYFITVFAVVIPIILLIISLIMKFRKKSGFAENNKFHKRNQEISTV